MSEDTGQQTSLNEIVDEYTEKEEDESIDAGNLQEIDESPIEGWKLRRLGVVFSLEYGENLTEDERDGGQYPVYGSNGQVGSHSEAYVDDPGIIIGRKGSIGGVEFSEKPFYPIDTTYYISQVETDENLRFLYYFLENIQLSRLNAASAIPGLNRNDAYSLKGLVPRLNEQRKIASVLYNTDRAIQKTEEIIEQTERVRKGIEQQLFTQGYFNHKDIETRRSVDLPINWDFEQLSEHTIESAFGPRYDSDKYSEDGNIATLRTTDLDRRGNISHETMPRADLNLDDYEKHLLQEGDIVISRSGAYSGITATWDGYKIPTIPGAYTIRFRLQESLIPKYLQYYFNSTIGKKRLSRRKRGSGQQNLSGTDILNITIPIPNKEEQSEIVRVIDSIEDKISIQREYKQHLHRLKRGQMQDLLTGKVRIADRDIEVLPEVANHG